MTKTDLTYEPSQLAYAKPKDGSTPTPYDKKQQQEPQSGTYKPKSTLPKDKPNKPSLPKYELDLPQAPQPPPSILPTDRPSSECLTRRQAADYIRDILGRPFSFSTASKLAALGEFAKPAVWWGRRPLYTPDDLRQWVDARSRPTNERCASKTVAAAAPSPVAANEENASAAITDS
jgi:hypothetical protein